MQSHPKAEDPWDWEREKGCSRLEVKKIMMQTEMQIKDTMSA